MSRWFIQLAPPLLATAALLALAPAPLGVRPANVRHVDRIPSLTDLPICPGTLGSVVSTPPPSVEAPDAGAWYRLDPRLDQRGSVTGQVLAVGAPGQNLSVRLDAESAASGPLGDGVLVVSDDGSQSRLAIIDARRGCGVAVGRSDDVVRRALLEPGGLAVVEHRLERSSRDSLGIWLRPLDGRAAVRILAPIASDERFGRTFSTELSWDEDGRLAVQSCGMVSCRTRIVEPTASRGSTADLVTTAVDDPDQGELIGMSGDLLVTYDACPGLPCSIVATDLRLGTRRVLAERAGLARLVGVRDGARLIYEVGGLGSGQLRSVSPSGGSEQALALVDGELIAPPPSRARSAMAVPPGWLLISPDGRAHSPGRNAIVDPLTGVRLELSEVIR